MTSVSRARRVCAAKVRETPSGLALATRGRMSLRPRRESIVALLLLASTGCGASSYLVAPSAPYPSGPIEALRGDSDERVVVRGDKLAFAHAVPIDSLRVRVRPRRPLGLV